MKGAFISDVDLRNGEGRVDGNEGGGYNEDFFFFLHLFLLSLFLLSFQNLTSRKCSRLIFLCSLCQSLRGSVGERKKWASSETASKPSSLPSPGHAVFAQLFSICFPYCLESLLLR